MFAAIERCSSDVSCVTMPIAARRLSCVTCAMSWPSIRMRPDSVRGSAAAGSRASTCRRPSGRRARRARRARIVEIQVVEHGRARRCARSRSVKFSKRISPRGTSSGRAPGRSTPVCGTAIDLHALLHHADILEDDVTSQLTQPAAFAICHASGSAVATTPALDRAVRPERDADRRRADEQQRVQHRERRT